MGWPRIPTTLEWVHERKEKKPLVFEGEAMPKDAVFPYLVTSRDGVHFNWQWVYGQIPLSFSPHLHFQYVQAANQFITVGGFHWMFYSANVKGHRDRWTGHEEVRLA